MNLQKTIPGALLARPDGAVGQALGMTMTVNLVREGVPGEQGRELLTGGCCPSSELT